MEEGITWLVETVLGPNNHIMQKGVTDLLVSFKDFKAYTIYSPWVILFYSFLFASNNAMDYSSPTRNHTPIAKVPTTCAQN